MSIEEARSPGSSLCFRCPGGRIGTGRFRAFLELFSDVSELTLMISRRQALAVRGSLGDVPDYLYRELSVDDLAGPNVKSYPYSGTPALQNYVIDQLSTVAAKTAGVTLSYSPTPTFRGNLRLDDLCLERNEDGRFTLEARLWSPDPRSLVDDVRLAGLPSLFAVLKNLFHEYPVRSELGKESLPDVRKKVYRLRNRVAPTRNVPDCGEEPSPRDPISERRFVGSPDNAALYERDGTHWLFVPVVAGILPDELTSRLRSLLDQFELLSMRLTPEQNLLLPFRRAEDALEARDRLYEVLPSTPTKSPRVSACPGSVFCSNVKTEPVELTQQLGERFLEDDVLGEFNRRHPVGITGCGETRDLERRHPIGLYPASTDEYRVSVGGTLHGKGRVGRELEETFSADELPDVLGAITRSFDRSASVEFQDWVHSDEFHPEEILSPIPSPHG